MLGRLTLVVKPACQALESFAALAVLTLQVVRGLGAAHLVSLVSSCLISSHASLAFRLAMNEQRRLELSSADMRSHWPQLHSAPLPDCGHARVLEFVHSSHCGGAALGESVRLAWVTSAQEKQYNRDPQLQVLCGATVLLSDSPAFTAGAGQSVEASLNKQL